MPLFVHYKMILRACHLVILFFPYYLQGQPQADFSINSGCNSENLKIENNSLNATTYQWDFCANDYDQLKSYASMVSSGSSNCSSFVMVEDNGHWYGFGVFWSGADRLIRFDYGDNPLNTPTLTGLGNPWQADNYFAQGIQVAKQNGNWYALISFQEFSSGILLIDFGSSLQNNPVSTQNLGSFGLTSRLVDIKLVKQGNDYILICAEFNLNTITRINFRDSFFNATTGHVHTTNNLGTNWIFGLDVVWTGTSWKGVLSSYNSNQIAQLNFGTDILSEPVVEDMYPSGVAKPYKVRIDQAGGHYYVAAGGETNSDVSIFDFFDFDIANDPVNLGHTSITGIIGFSMVRDQGSNFLIGGGASTTMMRAVFESVCGADKLLVEDENPGMIQYNQPGTKLIELIAGDVGGQTSMKVAQITVSTEVAPDLDFTSEFVCANHDVNFESVSLAGGIDTYTWDFGDAAGSASSTVTHQYLSAGNYLVNLKVLASNGCINFVERYVKIYAEPSADFLLPTGLICTNNEFTFTNTTLDNFDGNLSYQWLVNAEAASTDRNLLFTFESGGAKDITLQASIPGCTDEVTQALVNVGEGPVVDFSVDGSCLNETIQMTNASIGDVATYAWNFGNGTSSNDTNPALVYASNGIYTIELETTGVNGCVSTKTINHQIYSVPQPNFNTDLPPFSCNGTPTQFNDLTPILTDSNLESWSWNFGDGSSTASLQAPQHTYATSGDFTVEVTVTSDRGCVNQFTKDITISESPQPTINNAPACANVGVVLNETSGVSTTAWQWQIGNNFYLSSSPVHVFEEPGDYSVSLVVTAENGCIGSTSQTIHVPLAPNFDFEALKKCVGTEVIFMTSSMDSEDNVSAYTWNIDGQEFSGENTTYVFDEIGLQEITVLATTESGCDYSLSKAITIVAAPQANFSASKIKGPPPLAVQFTNLSTNGNSYAWSFNDAANTTTSAASPAFTFTEVGNYAVDLVVQNEEGCESSISKLIDVAIPLLFVSLENFEVVEDQNGLLQMRVSLNNQGNVDIQNLPLKLRLSNGTTLQETVDEWVVGGETKTIALGTAVSNTQDLQFICIEMVLDNNASTANEQLCYSLQEATVLTNPYPNPAKNSVTIEWVSAQEEKLNMTIFNSFGQRMIELSFLTQPGQNMHSLNSESWQEGLYFIKLQSTSAERTFRIIIAR